MPDRRLKKTNLRVLWWMIRPAGIMMGLHQSMLVDICTVYKQVSLHHGFTSHFCLFIRQPLLPFLLICPVLMGCMQTWSRCQMGRRQRYLYLHDTSESKEQWRNHRRTRKSRWCHTTCRSPTASTNQWIQGLGGMKWGYLQPPYPQAVVSSILTCNPDSGWNRGVKGGFFGCEGGFIFEV